MILKNADIITLKNGDTGVVAENVVVFSGSQKGVNLCDFSQDYHDITLRHKALMACDIVKVMRLDGFHEYKCVFESHKSTADLTLEQRNALVSTLRVCIEYLKPMSQFELIDKYMDLEAPDSDELGFNGFICTIGHFDSAMDGYTALEILQMSSNSKPLEDFTDFYWVHDGIIEYGNKLVDLLGADKYRALISETVKTIIRKYDNQAESGSLNEYAKLPEEFRVIADFVKEAK